MAREPRFVVRGREQFDWPLFLAVAVIAIIGVVNLYSATSPYIADQRRVGLADIYVTQVYWLVVGGLLGILVAVIDYRHFERLAYVLYGAGTCTLVLVFLVAADIRGSSRWIEVGSFTFQPSEFMKVPIVLAVARYLADHPEGVDPGFDFGSLINKCEEFVEVTGEVGDFIILHPYMLHASSNNHSQVVRFMTNPPVVLKEPMNFNRDDPEEFSLIELATLHGLGVDRYDFRPTAPRDEQWRVIG